MYTEMDDIKAVLYDEIPDGCLFVMARTDMPSPVMIKPEKGLEISIVKVNSENKEFTATGITVDGELIRFLPDIRCFAVRPKRIKKATKNGFFDTIIFEKVAVDEIKSINGSVGMKSAKGYEAIRPGDSFVNVFDPHNVYIKPAKPMERNSVEILAYTLYGEEITQFDKTDRFVAVKVGDVQNGNLVYIPKTQNDA